MKRNLLFLLILSLLLSATTISAQSFKLGFFTGYGMSSFEDFDDNAGTIPAGLQALISLNKMKFGSVDIGAEFNYSAVPFSFEIQQNGTKLADWDIKQMVIAALVKVKFLKKSKAHPFIRVGAGMYMGGSSFEYTDEAKQAAQQQNVTLQEDLDFDSAFGFNVGGGTDIDLNKKLSVFVEFLYHIVSRKPEGAPESGGANNWAIQVGLQTSLGK